MSTHDDIERYAKNLRDEIDGAALYAALAAAEKDPVRKELAREELGIDPEELGGNQWTAAGVSDAPALL
jgi:vacuolar iron transporter family protein